MVGAELRLKELDPKYFRYIKELFEDLMKRVSTFPEYIIITTSFEEFKKRLITRGRRAEKETIIEDDSWYKKYHERYTDILISYLKKYSIKYTIIDNTNFSKEDTKKEVEKIIKAT